MTICIPKNISDLLKNNIPNKALRSLSVMDIDKRNSTIDQIVNTFEINDEYKALMKKQIEDDVLVQAKGILEKKLSRTQKQASDKMRTTLKDKVLEINNLNGFSENLLDEITEVELGIALTPEQTQRLVESTEAVAKFTDEYGNIKEYSDEFGKAFKAYKETIANIAPSSFGKQLVSTGNANLLFGIKSAVTNVTSNSAFGAVASVDRTASMGTPYKFDKAFKQAIDDMGYYAKYGFDKTRAENLDDNIRNLGEVMTQFGERNKVEKFAKALNNIAYQKLLSTPDQFYASLAKTDTIYRLARNDIKADFPDLKVGSKEFDVKFDELVADAMQMSPQTDTGKFLREKGIAEANRVTFQEENTFTKFNTETRKRIDDISVEIASKIMPQNLADSFRVGTHLVPFAMTPANVIKTGIDYSGIKLPYDIFRTINTTISAQKSGDYAKGLKGVLDAMRDEGLDASFAKTAVGVTTALAVASLINPENYIGRFPDNARDRELLKSKKASTNSVKVGDIWISLDYLGPIGAPLIGIMELKKREDIGLGEALMVYGMGAGRQLGQIPALQGLEDGVSFVSKQVGASPQEVSANMFQGLMSFISSRSIATIVSDVGKATDSVERDTKNSEAYIGPVPIDPNIATKIPFLRQQLDERTDVFGIADKTTGFGEIFFGARVSIGTNDEVVKTLDDLANKGYNATPTDYVRTSTSFTVPDDKYNDERKEYGNRIYEAYKKEMSLSYFQNRTPDEKFERLGKIEDNVRSKFKKDMQRKYGKNDE